MMRGLGSGIKEFKDASKEEEGKAEEKKQIHKLNYNKKTIVLRWFFYVLYFLKKLSLF